MDFQTARNIMASQPEKPRQIGADPMDCRKCGARMGPGKATGQTFTGGMKDFDDDDGPVTFSVGGPGRLIDCLKCPDCGHSILE